MVFKNIDIQNPIEIILKFEYSIFRIQIWRAFSNISDISGIENPKIKLLI